MIFKPAPPVQGEHEGRIFRLERNFAQFVHNNGRLLHIIERQGSTIETLSQQMQTLSQQMQTLSQQVQALSQQVQALSQQINNNNVMILKFFKNSNVKTSL